MLLLLLQASDDTCTKMPSQAESLRQEMCVHPQCTYMSFSSSHKPYAILHAEIIHCHALILSDKNPLRRGQEIYIAIHSNHVLCNSSLL